MTGAQNLSELINSCATATAVRTAAIIPLFAGEKVSVSTKEQALVQIH